MRFLLDLFGGSPLLYAGAIVLFLAAIVLGLKLLELLGALAARRRPSRPRLELIESARIDRHRKVVLIRRDNVEYTLLTGGPEDLILEAGVPVRFAEAARPHGNPVTAPVEPTAQRPMAPAAATQELAPEPALTRALATLERRTSRSLPRRPVLIRPSRPGG
jgi:hypothetical protein